MAETPINPNSPDPYPRHPDPADEELGYRKVDEDATHDESPGPEGVGDDTVRPGAD